MNYMMVPIAMVNRNMSGSVCFVSQSEVRNKDMLFREFIVLDVELMEV